MNILLINDDGPPNAKHSPFIKKFAQALKKMPFCKALTVVLPATNSSWIGKGLGVVGRPHIEKTYYHLDDDNTSVQRRSDDDFILLSTAPASAANLALSLGLASDIDLVISGPNVGRNAGIQSILSSGTVGAALEASFLGYKAISLSFGLFFPDSFSRPENLDISIAHAMDLIPRLASRFTANISIINVNIPMISTPVSEIVLAPISPGGYTGLFAEMPNNRYSFRPTFNVDEAPEGSDTWCVMNGRIAITPIIANLVTNMDRQLGKGIVGKL
jgi:tubulin--tyrosine ligase